LHILVVAVRVQSVHMVPQLAASDESTQVLPLQQPPLPHATVTLQVFATHMQVVGSACCHALQRVFGHTHAPPRQTRLPVHAVLAAVLPVHWHAHAVLLRVLPLVHFFVHLHLPLTQVGVAVIPAHVSAAAGVVVAGVQAHFPFTHAVWPAAVLAVLVQLVPHLPQFAGVLRGVHAVISVVMPVVQQPSPVGQQTPPPVVCLHGTLFCELPLPLFQPRSLWPPLDLGPQMKQAPTEVAVVSGVAAFASQRARAGAVSPRVLVQKFTQPLLPLPDMPWPELPLPPLPGRAMASEARAAMMRAMRIL